MRGEDRLGGLQLFDEDEVPVHGAAIDDELTRVAHDLRSRDLAGDAFGDVIRDTFDQIYDGQRTGRWDPRQLRKTEKTHIGTLVEINLHKRFDFDDGSQMDYSIEGVEVDCKFTMSKRGWMIPPEAVGHLCLLLRGDDSSSTWSGGLLRILQSDLNAGNRDAKRTLNTAGYGRIRWIWRDLVLPQNLLLHLDPDVRSRILGARSGKGRESGQARVNELFRSVQGRLVRRSVVLTVARQLDSLKRPRDARKLLRGEGLLVLGHQQPDPMVAKALGLPDTTKGDFVSVRVVPAEPGYGGPWFSADGGRWRRAALTDPVVPAPTVNRAGV